MYNTVQEMHIAIDMALQHINSNRKQSIAPEYKDMALNYAVLQFIETRTTPKSNRKQEGFEDTVKRYDDLRELKRTFYSKARRAPNTTVTCFFPVDYYKYITAGAHVKFSKFSKPIAEVNDADVFQLLYMPDDTAEESYKNFIIRQINKDVEADAKDSLFSINDYPNVSSLYGADAKFIIINLVLEKFNNIGLSCYWEYYGDNYYKNTFIILGDNRLSLSYTGYTTLSSIKSNGYKVYDELETNIKEVDLVSSEHIYGINNTYHQKSNRHNNPVAFIRQNSLYVKEGEHFIVDGITLEYIKKPRLINHKTNQSCELTINREIIDLAVQKLKAYVKDEGYQHIVNENQIIE